MVRVGLQSYWREKSGYLKLEARKEKKVKPGKSRAYVLEDL